MKINYSCNMPFLRVSRQTVFAKHLTKICVLISIILLSVFLCVKRGRDKKNRNYFTDTILDIMDDEQPPKGSIFFIDSTYDFPIPVYTELNFRRACSLESTAKLHPNSTVYILYTTPVIHPTEELLKSNRYAPLKQIYKLKNVLIRSLDVLRFVKGTPIEEWFLSGKLKESAFAVVHLSDVLRLVALWRYGGTYMDLDIVAIKSLYELGINYAGIEDRRNDNKLNNAVINFENYGIGREITEACLKEIAKNYASYHRAANGPFLISRVIEQICKTGNISSIKEAECGGFHPLPYWAFYPYNWGEWNLPFQSDHLQTGLENVKNSYIIHLYSHSSDTSFIVKNESQVLYGVLAKEYCPDSYDNCGDKF